MTAPRRQVIWNLVDQALSSSSNFAVAIGVAGQASATEFGLFSLGFIVYAVTLSVNRTLCVEPFAVCSLELAGTLSGKRVALRLAGVCVTVGVLGSTLMVIVTAAVGPQIPVAVWILVGTLPLLALEDFYRGVAVASMASGRACLADGVWLVATLLGFAGPAGTEGSAVFVALWAVGGILGLLTLLVARRTPTAGRSSMTAKSLLHLGKYPAAENLLVASLAQLSFLIAAYRLGPEAVAGPRGALVLFGGLTVAATGLTQWMLPYLARYPSRTVPVVALLQTLLVTGASGTAGFLIFMPEAWGRILLGDSWDIVRVVIPPMTVYSIAVTIAAVGAAEVRLRRVSRRLFAFRVSISWIGPVIAYVSTASGVREFAWGLAFTVAADALAVYACLVLVRRGQRNAAPEVVSSESTTAFSVRGVAELNASTGESRSDNGPHS